MLFAVRISTRVKLPCYPCPAHKCAMRACTLEHIRPMTGDSHGRSRVRREAGSSPGSSDRNSIETSASPSTISGARIKSSEQAWQGRVSISPLHGYSGWRSESSQVRVADNMLLFQSDALHYLVLLPPWIRIVFIDAEGVNPPIHT